MKTRTGRRVAAVCAVLCMATASSGLADLYAMYTFNVPDGANVKEFTGVHSGSLFNSDGVPVTASYVDAPGHKAIHFDGTAPNHINWRYSKASPDVLPTTMRTNMTTVYWVRFEQVGEGYMCLMSEGGNNGNSFHNTLQWEGTAPHAVRSFCNYPHPPEPADTTHINAGTWYNLAWTLEGPANGSLTQKFYINGVLKDTRTATTCNFFAGARSGAQWISSAYRDKLTGDIDEIRLYDHALDDAEVLQLYTDGPSTPLPLPAPYAQYTFNLRTGSSIKEHTGAHPDATFRANGVLAGATYKSAPGYQAVHFDGAVPNHINWVYAETPSDALPANMHTNMSMVYWMRFEASTDGYMTLMSEASSTQYKFHNTLQWTGTSPYQARNFANYPYGAGTIDADTWYNLVWTLQGPADGSLTQRFYIDGILRQTSVNTDCLFGTAGARSGAQWMNGYKDKLTGDMDELRIYDRALNSEEVYEMYAMGPVAPVTGAMIILQ